MSEQELLTCPFCGGAAEFERKGDRRQSTIVACTQCGARLESGEEWGHGSAWNTRPAPTVEQAAGWQPIETAPKDGTEFIGGFDNGDVVVCYYLDNTHASFPWAGFRPKYGIEPSRRELIQWRPMPHFQPPAGGSHE